jgi:3-hydroxyisobutyrate dehydrogenase-like beta-hydroxyacid dehydrogenase
MNEQQSTVIALIGTGEMGTAVGVRLAQHGARVRTSLKGRSGASRQRVSDAKLEIVEDDHPLIHDADFVLSIVPPGVAVEVAERFRAPLSAAPKAPVYADCNAISPATARNIGEILAESRCRYVDAGIIGGPPPADPAKAGPRFFASGAHAQKFAELSHFGLDVVVLDGPIGAASGLKLSYAGLTKGTIALGIAMIAAASRDGLAEALRAELLRTQPQILNRLANQVPATFPKAYRWIAEMEQIAEFLGDDAHGSRIYSGAARIFETIAAGNPDSAELISRLSDFCASAASPFKK